MKALLPLLSTIAFGIVTLTPCRAGDLAQGARRAGHTPARMDAAAGCGAYGTHDCQFVPRLGGDGKPGPVYEDGPRCGWRWTPIGSRRLCRAF